MYDFGDYNPEKFDPIRVEFRDSTRRKKRKQQKGDICRRLNAGKSFQHILS